MKGQTLKISRARTAFYKATIIPMVSWRFIRAGFRLNSDNVFGPLSVNPETVIGRIAVPEITLEQFVTPGTLEAPLSTRASIRSRWQIPGPHEFAVSLQAYVDKGRGTWPLCGHSEEEDSSEEVERTPE
jgi:hypothetical protein